MDKNIDLFNVILGGNGFKYEIEATLKLFMPGVRFRFFAHDDLCDFDRDNVSDLKSDGFAAVWLGRQNKDGKNGKTRRAFAYIRTGGRGKRRAAKISACSENVLEYELCRLVYTLLRDFFDYSPPWGMLTGIRPVRLLDSLPRGLTFGDFREKYFVSEEKLKLALETRAVQAPFLTEENRKKVSFYVSVPFCPSRCRYCSFVSHSVENAYKLIPEYIKYLCREIEITGEIILKSGLEVAAVYVGGGTPTALSAEQLREVLAAVNASVSTSGSVEYTVEAGRADTVTEEKITIIRDMGATRISINPQTFNDGVLRGIGRRHTAEDVRAAFRLARRLGFGNINMDLIAGLPGDDLRGFQKSLDETLALSPENISLHTLTRKRSSEIYDGAVALNEGKIAAEMTEYAYGRLSGAGYRPYYLYRQKNTVGNLENTGFSKAGTECLYNIFIMDDTQTILGAGCGASTKIVRDGGEKITRLVNYKFPYEYIGRFDEMLKKKHFEI